MRFMKCVLIVFFLAFVLSCTPKNKESSSLNTQVQLPAKSQTEIAKPKQPDFNKTLREAIYFSSSLEREALKLILNNNFLQKQSLFSVLSFIVEINAGAKKSTPFGLDCGKFEIQRTFNAIKIFKSCVKPIIEVAEINIISENSLFNVEFMIKEWANIVGMPVALTGDNVKCQLQIKEQKLNRLNCDNWSYLTTESRTSSTVIKAKTFLFERDAQKQFIIKGGFFKELIENKKLDIVVPLEGKIKIIEKEIKVIDDFAKIIEKDLESSQKNVESEKKEEPKIEAAQENRQENKQEGSQENNQESQQETTQVSGEQSQAQQEEQSAVYYQDSGQESIEISSDSSPAPESTPNPGTNPQDGESRRRGR